MRRCEELKNEIDSTHISLSTHHNRPPDNSLRPLPSLSKSLSETHKSLHYLPSPRVVAASAGGGALSRLAARKAVADYRAPQNTPSPSTSLSSAPPCQPPPPETLTAVAGPSAAIACAILPLDRRS
ncbi:hypothetical protein Scep_014177 [Stephania cephalantha]|uniref:Uncharacterized protein n=1 Tax=Stephania cephalantha TaxID=152367 RepID=A0AAP0J0Q6_9MAGN